MESAARVELDLYNPTGLLETTIFHAPRLPDLAGRTLCELSNDRWRDYMTFPLIREALRKRLPNTRIIPFTEFPIGPLEIDVDGIAEIIKQKGCDAVIGGNAG
ncbi:MAG: hypothetical protein HYX90_05045 [Chloroflexi bacterium]|nr:hypothetical protein [Chloroflexota bacterium]